MNKYRDYIQIHPQSQLSDPHYTGPVFIFDIDKTYLATHFESLKGLFKAAFEKAHQKENIAGSGILLQELQRGPEAMSQKIPIFFITASPKQMRKVIETKIKLDGIDFDGIIFKDNLRNIYTGKFKKIKEQIGFKLVALLKLKIAFPENSVQYLFGDDFENDAIIYSLYSDICNHFLSDEELTHLLKGFRVFEEDIEIIFQMKSQIKISNSIKRIFIHLEKKTHPVKFKKLGGVVIPTFNNFQASLHLFDLNLVSLSAVIRMANHLIQDCHFTEQELVNSFFDSLARNLIQESTALKLMSALMKHKCFPSEIQFPRLKWWWIAIKKFLSQGTPPLVTPRENHYLKYLDEF